MIFKRIVLHNFGIYKGKHEIDLEPPSPEKPIILFGGLNGGGKTTFLTAISTGAVRQVCRLYEWEHGV